MLKYRGYHVVPEVNVPCTVKRCVLSQQAPVGHSKNLPISWIIYESVMLPQALCPATSIKVLKALPAQCKS